MLQTPEEINNVLGRFYGDGNYKLSCSHADDWWWSNNALIPHGPFPTALDAMDDAVQGMKGEYTIGLPIQGDSSAHKNLVGFRAIIEPKNKNIIAFVVNGEYAKLITDELNKD